MLLWLPVYVVRIEIFFATFVCVDYFNAADWKCQIYIDLAVGIYFFDVIVRLRHLVKEVGWKKSLKG